MELRQARVWISSRGSTAKFFPFGGFSCRMWYFNCAVCTCEAAGGKKLTFQHQEKLWRCSDLGDCCCFGSIHLLFREHPPLFYGCDRTIKARFSLHTIIQKPRLKQEAAVLVVSIGCYSGTDSIQDSLVSARLCVTIKVGFWNTHHPATCSIHTCRRWSCVLAMRDAYAHLEHMAHVGPFSARMKRN